MAKTMTKMAENIIAGDSVIVSGKAHKVTGTDKIVARISRWDTPRVSIVIYYKNGILVESMRVAACMDIQVKA